MPLDFRVLPFERQFHAVLEPIGEACQCGGNGPGGKTNAGGPGELRKHFLQSGDRFSGLIANQLELLMGSLKALLRRRRAALGGLHGG